MFQQLPKCLPNQDDYVDIKFDTFASNMNSHEAIEVYSPPRHSVQAVYSA
jgi:hypothetical protein